MASETDTAEKVAGIWEKRHEFETEIWYRKLWLGIQCFFYMLSVLLAFIIGGMKILDGNCCDNEEVRVSNRVDPRVWARRLPDGSYQGLLTEELDQFYQKCE